MTHHMLETAMWAAAPFLGEAPLADLLGRLHAEEDAALAFVRRAGVGMDGILGRTRENARATGSGLRGEVRAIESALDYAQRWADAGRDDGAVLRECLVAVRAALARGRPPAEVGPVQAVRGVD